MRYWIIFGSLWFVRNICPSHSEDPILTSVLDRLFSRDLSNPTRVALSHLPCYWGRIEGYFCLHKHHHHRRDARKYEAGSPHYSHYFVEGANSDKDNNILPDRRDHDVIGPRSHAFWVLPSVTRPLAPLQT